MVFFKPAKGNFETFEVSLIAIKLDMGMEIQLNGMRLDLEEGKE